MYCIGIHYCNVDSVDGEQWNDESVFFGIDVTWQKFVFFGDFEGCGKVEVRGRSVVVVATDIEITGNIKALSTRRLKY